MATDTSTGHDPTKSHNPLPVRDKSGREHCYNCVIEAHQTAAHNLAIRMLSDWSLAEDATQEVFLSGYRAFGKFRGENLKSWIMQIVANTCRDALRARKSRPTVSLDFSPLDPESADPGLDLPSSEESPESHVLRMELGKAIQDGLNALPEERRIAVVLVDVQGYSYEETAEIMKTSIGTVKSRLARGRAGIQDFLQDYRELLPTQFRHNE